MLDLAFALRFEKIIISAYAWLVDNYQAGDRIFLFGFSRGAYQVRALAAMIDIVGLLHKGNNDQIPFAYELYAESSDESKRRLYDAYKARFATSDSEPYKPSFPWPNRVQTPDNPETQEVTLQEQFKRKFSRPEVLVHFVGAWDTVSSVGFVRDKTLPSTTDGMKSTCFFRHALALHEFRVKFLPEYANGGAGPSLQSTIDAKPHTKEVWFTGSHSDIGGGSTTNTALNKFGAALRWMSWEATLAGLRLFEPPNSWEQIIVSKSMTAIWRIVECLPIKRLTYKSAQSVTWLPHLFGLRKIQEGQRIHQSVYEECGDFRQDAGIDPEPDAYVVLRPREDVLRRGRILDEPTVRSFNLLVSSAEDLRSLRDLDITRYIYETARSSRGHPANARILDDLRFLHVGYVRGSLRVYGRVPSLHGALDISISTSSETFPFQMCGHSGPVSSVAFLSDTLAISGSWDNTLRVWEVGTGDLARHGPMHGHMNAIAVCATRGLIASPSGDSTIRLWTFDGNSGVYPKSVLHDRSMGIVWGVAFSPDGSHLASVSEDGAIRMWNARASGTRPIGEPVRGHARPALSVVFSSDGTRLVSGAADGTVRLWEWSPGKGTLRPLGDPLVANIGPVRSVAFSPDGLFIASGSWDYTVRLWHADTLTLKNTLRGHSGQVLSVAFAPCGQYIASSSTDWTVRTWDTQTGATVRVLLGHTDEVWSVAFSPNSRRIASGSRDHTVRVWDLADAHDEPPLLDNTGNDYE